jgi:hypothetical protein
MQFAATAAVLCCSAVASALPELPRAQDVCHVPTGVCSCVFAELQACVRCCCAVCALHLQQTLPVESTKLVSYSSRGEPSPRECRVLSACTLLLMCAAVVYGVGLRPLACLSWVCLAQCCFQGTFQSLLLQLDMMINMFPASSGMALMFIQGCAHVGDSCHRALSQLRSLALGRC